MAAALREVKTQADLAGVDTKKAVLVFYASWEAAGKQMVEMIKEIGKSGRFSQVSTWCLIEAEGCDAAIIKKYKVTAVPTLIFLLGGKVWRTLEGADSGLAFRMCSEFEEAEAQHIPEDDDDDALENEAQKLEIRLQQLIHTAPIMIFMKGSPSEPRCKYSRGLMETLEGKLEFASFDILQDDTVRQGLKQYFPTYPQIYIEGKLFGGLEDVKALASETKEDTSLKDTFLKIRLKTLVQKAPVMLFMKGVPGAPRCGFSRTITQILTEAEIKFDTFDILEDNEVRQALKTYSQWPTYPQLYVNGDLVGGLDIIKELLADPSMSLKEHLNIPNSALQAPTPMNIEEDTHTAPVEDLNARLEKLVRRSPVMLFMKGKPSAPECGFSRTISELLTDADITYDTFDILQDNDVRQGLKAFSQWPTYPQLYVNGSLIGGLDILQEMAQEGNLKEQLLEGSSD